jgi:hypothetical protein
MKAYQAEADRSNNQRRMGSSKKAESGRHFGSASQLAFLKTLPQG